KAGPGTAFQLVEHWRVVLFLSHGRDLLEKIETKNRLPVPRNNHGMDADNRLFLLSKQSIVIPDVINQVFYELGEITQREYFPGGAVQIGLIPIFDRSGNG
ncbi:MAG: hypothetical protein Q8N74_05755, partial [Sulfuricella sp.]|nr:hypothetical protein [Sulfuricella sp.]